MDLAPFAYNFVIVLLAGTASSILCRKLGVSALAGHLVVGALIGFGGMRLVDDPGHELELVAEAGALLLLFSVGIEFSIDELAKLGRYFFVGGAVQMAAVAGPLTAVAHLAGFSLPAALLAGAAGALSSTILVFRALSEEGQVATPHGRRAIAVLLFQDAALVPLLLLTPLLTGDGPPPTGRDYLLLALKATSFLSAVFVLHASMQRFAARWLSKLRSVEIVVLVTVTSLCGLSWVAHLLGLPAAVGAFAAGLVLSGNCLSRQIDAIVLPFRETFAAVFFVTLGMLLDPHAALAEPLLLAAGVVGMVAFKTLAAGLALRVVGLPWGPALGMGLGLSQLGEFSFLLVSRGVSAGLITPADYNRMLFIAVVTLIATPLLLRYGLRGASGETPDDSIDRSGAGPVPSQAAVVGIGPIGGQLASRLETDGVAVTLLDLSPVNLHRFAQGGFATHAGDARDPATLRHAGGQSWELVAVCVPNDDVALEVVRAVRLVNPTAPIVVRCRLQSYAAKLRRAGATAVVSEEAEAVGPLTRECERFVRRSDS